MKTTKKVITTMLTIIIVVASNITLLASPSAWAEEQVYAAIELDLVPPNLQHYYQQTITRAEFTALAVSLYEAINGEIIGRRTFADTSDINVQKMAYLGVVDGVGNNRFNPHGAITRQQAAVMLARLAHVMGHTFPLILPLETPAFADRANISSWAVESVDRARAAGIMSGVGNNNFAPNQPYTREQSIVTMLRLFEMINVTSNEPPEIGAVYHEVGTVIIIANGVEHLPHEHFSHGVTIGMSVSGLPLMLEEIARQLQEISYSNDFDIVIAGDDASSVRFSLYDENFNNIYSFKDGFVPPTESGVFLLSIDVVWGNVNISASMMRYVFMVRV